MVTNQIMLRDFSGGKISQRTSDKFFNATELLRIFNDKNGVQKSFDNFWELKNVQEFVKELENDLILNTQENGYLKTHETSRGRGGATWMHPYLFVKFAMWLSPKFELQIIKWVYDNLIDFRHEAGDYYKEMNLEVQEYYKRNDIGINDPLIYIKEANFLNILVFGSPKAKQRNLASENQLALMNELQEANIYLLKKDTKPLERKNALLHTKNLFLDKLKRKCKSLE